MLKVCETKCDQCLFTKDRIVSADRMKQILAECARDDTHFICHKASIAGQDACCRGFYETQSSNLLRIAQRLGAVEFIPVPNDS